jgi:hypothetical protein
MTNPDIALSPAIGHASSCNRRRMRCRLQRKSLCRSQGAKRSQRPQAAPRVAADVSVIHWACFGMREVQTDDGLLGLERLAQRIQDDIEAIAEEVRS